MDPTGLLEHRGYILRTALADVRHRYAGAGAGVLWNILGPLIQIGVYAVVFTQIMKRHNSADAPYIIYLCSAMLPWLAFTECVSRGCRSLTANSQYLRKLPIPEGVFVAQTVVSAGIGLAISYTVLAVLAVPFGYVPTWHWLLAPVPFVLLLLLAFGVAGMAAAVYPFIRDIGEIVQIGTMVGFWAYPVVYDPGFLSEWVQELLPFNPAYPALEAGRQLIIHARTPDPWLLPAALGWGVAFAAAGLLALRAVRAEVRDVI